MNIIKRISGLFSVMEDEVRSFRLLFLQSLFIGFANSYYYIVSSSYIIKNVDIQYLPTAYIISGLGGFFLIKLYKQFQKKSGITGGFRLSLLVFTGVCILNFFAIKVLGKSDQYAAPLAYFIVLFATPFTAIFSLGVFAQCSRLYNIAQSKRLLALVVSGEILASVIAYLSIPFLRGFFNKGDVSALLLVAAVFTLLVLIPFNKLHALYHDRLHVPVVAKEAVKMNLDFFRKNNFYMLIGITTLFSVFAIYVVDYAYLISVRYMHEISPFEIAEIVSVFFFTVKLGELSFSFISGNILSNKGIRYSLLLLPVILLLSALSAFVFGFIFHGLPVFLLAFLFLAKLVERAIRKSITTPSVKVMYQVAEPHERLQIEANIDGILNQVATVLSGILLLIVSYFFFSKDMFSLLHLFSFVCIVAFALWGFFSVRMYDSYRLKIKDFLARLRRSSANAPILADIAGDSNAEAIHSLSFDKVNIALEVINKANKKQLLDLIKTYNQVNLPDFSFDKESTIAKKLINIYYSNNTFFNSLLIIRYLQFCTAETAFTFIRELWEISDLACRLEMLIAYNDKAAAVADRAYFERLCEECVKELIWTESAIHDILPLKDDELEKGLNDHRLLLVHLLSELLKSIYDPSVIQVIFDIITNDKSDLENEIFALELLDITLDENLKEMIKHTLEPTSLENKKQKLQKMFHIYLISPKERLVDILMKDYNLVDPGLKELVLEKYYKLYGDKVVLAAFRSSSIENLRATADELLTSVNDPAYHARLDMLRKVQDRYVGTVPYAAWLLNHAIASAQKQRSATGNTGSNMITEYTIEARSETNIPVKLDALAVAVLISLKQNI